MDKKILAAISTAAICSFLGFGVAMKTAKAATPISYNTFTMEDGAAARIKSLTDEQGNVVESNGLRFSAEISQTEYDNLKAAGARFGMVIVAKDLLKGTEIDANTVFGANPAFYFTNETGGDTSKIAMLNIANASCQNIDNDEQIEISGAIVNIQINNFTRSFIGRAYVAIPQINAETGETEYQYYFAPYYDENVENNTRCIYYIAQRAIEEEKAEAETLQQKYIKPFEATSRYQNYTYRYVVEHCYIAHNSETNEHEILHTEIQYNYDKLNATVEAQPIIKPQGVPAIADLNFVYDLDASLETNTGLVYAAGMQTLRLYYETAGTITEEHKHDTIEALIADFLKVENAEKNFGLHLNAEVGGGTAEDWEASAVLDPNFSDDPNDPNDEPQQIGIALTATNNANKNRHLLLSKDFFDQLRAFGVESIIFSFHSAPGSKKEALYNLYQEEDTSQDVRVFNAKTQEDLTGKTIDSSEHSRIQIYLSDITEGGGVLIEVTTSSTSNVGAYHFGDIDFTFPKENQEN